MKFVGFCPPVPWYSLSKRSSVVGTCRILRATKYSSLCGIGVRRSSSPVMMSVGVVTFLTYMSGDSLSQAWGSSQNGLSNHPHVKSGVYALSALLHQSLTG